MLHYVTYHAPSLTLLYCDCQRKNECINLLRCYRNGKRVPFSAYFGIWTQNVNQDALTEELKKNGLQGNDVVSLKMESDEIIISWGAQFSSFPNLESVVLIAQNIIRLNCDNFKGSTVRMVSLSANELWFNDGAFCEANSLEYVTCNGTILDGNNFHGGLGEMLFKDCHNLKAVRGTYKGTNVMPYVFTNCPSLEEPLNLYVKSLGNCTFMDCTNLKHIHLHNGLIELGHSTFKNCISLEDIYIPDTVISLGLESFAGCSKLKSIHLPKNLSGIPSGTFADCSELKKVFLSDEITHIGAEAFKGCSLLHRPWFPEKLESIGKRAFQGCVSLEKIFLPENISEIEEDAFSDCGNLIIHGKPGSVAEDYAKNHNFSFVADE